MSENRNSYVVKDILDRIDKLKQAIADLHAEDDNLYHRPQFLIDDDDEYQDALEKSWHRSEIRESIEAMKDEMYELQQQLIDISK